MDVIFCFIVVLRLKMIKRYCIRLLPVCMLGTNFVLFRCDLHNQPNMLIDQL